MIRYGSIVMLIIRGGEKVKIIMIRTMDGKRRVLLQGLVRLSPLLRLVTCADKDCY